MGEKAAACSDCAFWKRLDFETSRGWYEIAELERRMRPTEDDYDYALPSEVLREWGVCSRELEPNAPMYTVDGSGYHSSLSTLATFSCAEFKPTTSTDSGG